MLPIQRQPHSNVNVRWSMVFVFAVCLFPFYDTFCTPVTVMMNEEGLEPSLLLLLLFFFFSFSFRALTSSGAQRLCSLWPPANKKVFFVPMQSFKILSLSLHI